MYVLDKYEPKRLSEHICRDAAMQLQQWYDSGHKKPLLILGSTGIGKSTLVRVFAKDNKLSLYELNPSDSRDKDSIEMQIKAASSSSSLFGSKNLLFFDDVDAFFNDDRGGAELICSVAKEARNPVIFIATDLYKNKKTMKFKEISDVIEVKRPTSIQILSVLKIIANEEKISYDDSSLKTIAQNSVGDLRSAILDLHSLLPLGVNSATISEIGARERLEDAFKTVINLFKSKSYSESLQYTNSSDLESDMLYAWICENIHLFYNSENLAKAYNFASLGDINKSRIYVRQNWTFLKYYIALGIIAPTLHSNKDKFSYKISFPSFIRKMSKETSEYARNKKAAEILKRFIHGSRMGIISNIEYYKIIFSNPEIFNILKTKINDDELEFISEFFGVKFSKAEKVELEEPTPKKEKPDKKQKTLF